MKEQLILVSELSSRAASEKEEERSSTAAGGGLSSTSGGEDGDGEREVPGGGTSTSLLLLEGLADGEHELRYVCPVTWHGMLGEERGGEGRSLRGCGGGMVRV